MTIRYVGPGGNDGNSGLTWALRKLTLNGVEDTPVVAGDTVYVGPGTYREMLTVDVSGGAGTPISYIGDYSGANTDGVGGVVRITGSDNDQAAVRADCIVASDKDYRTFTGFALDTCTSYLVNATNSCLNWTIEHCILSPSAALAACYIVGSVQSGWLFDSNAFLGRPAGQWGQFAISCFSGGADVLDAQHVIRNCLFLGNALYTARIAGVTIRNCQMLHGDYVTYTFNPAGGVVYVYNSLIANCQTALGANALGEVVEDYNTFCNNATNRSNVAVGANSLTYPPLLDTRWFFELVGGGNMLSPWDLASYSQLIDVAGIAPPATDMRGTGLIGAAREWGPLEYDPTLEIEGGGGMLQANKRGNKQ